MLTAQEIGTAADKVLEVMAALEVGLRSRMVEGVVAGVEARTSAPITATLKAEATALVPTAEAVVSKAITSTAATGLTRDEALHAAARTAGLIGPYADLADSVVMAHVLREGVATAQKLTNLVMSSAVQAANAEYLATLDTALLQVVTGAATPTTAIRAAVDQIARNTCVVTYAQPGGGTVETTIYSAVRRNVITAANQTTLRMQDARMAEVGAEWVETTAHAGPRPEHAEWQGQVIKFSDLADVTGYGDVTGLGGANCGHSYFPYYPGIMEPNTHPELSGRDNEEDYKLSQRQRECERNVRQYQGRADIYKAAGGGFESDAAHNKALASKWRAESKDVAAKRQGAVRGDRAQANMRDRIAESKVAAAKK